jgi:hypothetical protein
MADDPGCNDPRNPAPRRRMPLALFVLALLALAVCGAAMASLWQQAERARQEAETARAAEAQARTAAEQAQREAEQARAALARANEQRAAIEYGRAIQIAHLQSSDNNLALAKALFESALPSREWDAALWNRQAPLRELAPPPREVKR